MHDVPIGCGLHVIVQKLENEFKHLITSQLHMKAPGVNGKSITVKLNNDKDLKIGWDNVAKQPLTIIAKTKDYSEELNSLEDEDEDEDEDEEEDEQEQLPGTKKRKKHYKSLKKEKISKTEDSELSVEARELLAKKVDGSTIDSSKSKQEDGTILKLPLINDSNKINKREMFDVTLPSGTQVSTVMNINSTISELIGKLIDSDADDNTLKYIVTDWDGYEIDASEKLSNLNGKKKFKLIQKE